MAVIYLHGALGEKYGRRFVFSIHSVGEAVRLLSANFADFKRDVLRYSPGFVIRVNGRDSSDFMAVRELYLAPEIHIVPAIAGAGGDKNGFGRVLLGVALIAASYYGGFSQQTTGLLFNAGVNMTLSGVSSMLFSTKQSAAESSDMTGETSLPNYAFNGPVNTTAQGNPVPVLYGRLRVGSQVISAGISAE